MIQRSAHLPHRNQFLSPHVKEKKNLNLSSLPYITLNSRESRNQTALVNPPGHSETTANIIYISLHERARARGHSRGARPRKITINYTGRSLSRQQSAAAAVSGNAKKE